MSDEWDLYDGPGEAKRILRRKPVVRRIRLEQLLAEIAEEEAARKAASQKAAQPKPAAAKK